MKVFSIKDTDIGSFNQPFYNQTEVEAIRNVLGATNNSQLADFPDSFTLYEIASFEPNEGKFINLESPRAISTVSTLINNRKLASKNEESPPKTLRENATGKK